MDMSNKKEENEIAKGNAQAKADLLDIQMTNKYCPINKDCCSKTCVHFKAASVFNAADGYGPRYKIIDPACKLWK